jgi:hypothetical protein
LLLKSRTRSARHTLGLDTPKSMPRVAAVFDRFDIPRRTSGDAAMQQGCRRQRLGLSRPQRRQLIASPPVTAPALSGVGITDEPIRSFTELQELCFY